MKKILTIDGGGIKGVFPASFLATLEESIPGKVGEYFDLIVGTSTGGIIAVALGLGFSGAEILALYQDLGRTVFADNGWRRLLRQVRIAKYDSAPLRAALLSEFGERRLGESAARLVIPSVNLNTGEVHIFKTAHHPRLATDFRELAVDVALATAAAPTYFPTHVSAAGVPLIDGGLWANNPAGMAAVEALSMLDWKKGEFEILSISCTGSPLDVDVGRGKGHGLAYWGLRIVDTMFCAQSSASLGTALHLAGHDHVVRIDPSAPAGRYKLDSTEHLLSLAGLGRTEARKALPTLRDRFFGVKAEPFVPFHTL
jgi:hypothetical protein